MALINPDFVSPLVSLFVDNHERAHYYSELMSAAFLALFWLFSFFMFFDLFRIFRGKNKTTIEKIISVCLLVSALLMWPLASILMFNTFQEPAVASGYVIGMVFGTILFSPLLVINQRLIDIKTQEKERPLQKTRNQEIENEKVKLKSNFYNAISLALIGTVLITPITNSFIQPNQNPFNQATSILILLGFVLAVFFHILARHALNGLIKEEKPSGKNATA